MQLWVSKLNKNKWKIALIILSVALVTSCIFGFTSAWFNKVEQAKANVGMDVKYVDIFANADEDQHELIPAKYYQPSHVPEVLVKETEGTYCVFLQIKESGGKHTTGAQFKGTYIDYKVNSNWNPIDNDAAVNKILNEYKFSDGGEYQKVSYYYQTIDASQVAQEDGTLPVFEQMDNAPKGEPFQANPDLTLDQVYAAKESDGTPITISVVAAGCKTVLPKGSKDLPTAQEVAFAEVYTAFF